MPLVIRTNSGAPGSKAAQHSQSLEAWFMHIPGLKVVTPSIPADAKGLLKSAIRDDDPVLFLEHKRLYFGKGEVPAGDWTVPLGVAAVRRTGEHVTVVANQLLVGQALEAAEILSPPRHRPRGHRRADDQPARHGDHQRLRAQDGSAHRRP